MVLRLGMTVAPFTTSLLLHDHFHLDLLKRDLVVDQIKQFERALVGPVVAAQLDPRMLTGELGMSGVHLAIEQKRNVSVEFFLELMKPLVRTVPRTRFAHGENDLARLFIEAEKIDHRRIGDT